MHRSQPYSITVHCYTLHDWTQTQWTWTSLLTLLGEIIHSEALFQTQCHFLTKDDHWSRRMFDWRNLMASTPLREMAASDGGLNMDHVLSEGRTALSRPWSSWAAIDNFLKYAWDAHREGHSQIHTCTHTHTRKKTQTKTTSAWMSPPMLRGHIFPPHTHTYRYISTSGTSTPTLFFFSICTLSQITWSPHWHKSLSSRNHKSLTDANFGSGQILTVCIQNSNYSYMYKMNRVFFPKIIPK